MWLKTCAEVAVLNTFVLMFSAQLITPTHQVQKAFPTVYDEAQF